MLKVLELFAGIGACSKALKRLCIPYEIVDAVEIDKFAIKSFNAIHNTNFEIQDIKNWDKNLEVDLIIYGSPCQDFSIAGKQAGGDKGSGTRSSLLYEALRIVEKLKPKYVIWENVKNILSPKHKNNFDNCINKMEQLGYKNYYQVLNAKDFGVPQNRERVFTVSIKNEIDKSFCFPEKQELQIKLKDILENNVEEKYFLDGKNISYLTSNDNEIKVVAKLDIKGQDVIKRVYSGEGISPTLTNMQGGNRQPKIITAVAMRGRYSQNGNVEQKLEISNREIANAITTVQKDSMVANEKLRIRKLTPKECWRLMGFSDHDFAKCERINSNTQLYKQAGNSIVVNVLEAILENLLL